MNALKFYWNGIKGSDGKLQRAYYSIGNWANKSEEMIRIYGKRYRDFSAEVAAEFKCEDGSDPTTDYFEQVHIDVYPSHPLYGQVLEACKKAKEHNAKMLAKKMGKYSHV